jgi:hypothetical protein
MRDALRFWRMTDPVTIASGACMPNPALEPLAFLIGQWRTTGTHPGVPGETLVGRTSFAWHAGGAFVIMRNEVDHPDFPDGVAIIGSDGSLGTFAMTYFDERGISRLMEVAVGDRAVTWRHDDPTFTQTLAIRAEGADKLISAGRMSQNGGAWEDDLSQVFERA